MSFENKSGLNVHNHYGPRDVGGANGAYTASGNNISYAIDLVGERNPKPVYVTGPGRVTDVWVEAGTKPAGANSIKIGTVDVTAASGATPVRLATGGEVVLTSAFTKQMGAVHFSVEQDLA